MISFHDYKDAEGNIDWQSYDAAQIASGEKCRKCGKLIYPGKGYESSCYDCDSLYSGRSSTHDQFIRCPKCGESWNPCDHEDYSVYEEGEHEVWCHHCEHTFKVSTTVSYNFDSGSMLDDEEDED